MKRILRFLFLLNICLIFTLFFTGIVYLGQLKEKAFSKIQVVVYLKKGINKEELEEVRLRIYSFPISNVGYLSAEERLKNLGMEHLLGVLKENPLFDSFFFYLRGEIEKEEFERMISSLTSLSGVREVEYPHYLYDKIFRISFYANQMVKIGGIVLFLLLFLLFCLSSILLRKEEREDKVLEFFGASPSFLTLSRLGSGAISGFFAGAISAGFLFIISSFIPLFSLSLSFMMSILLFCIILGFLTSIFG